MVHYDSNSHEPLFKVSPLQVCDVWDHVSDAERPLGMMSPVTWWSSLLSRELATGMTQVPMKGVFFGGGEILSTPNDSFVIRVSFAYINNLSQLVYFLTMNNLVHLFAFCPLSLLKRDSFQSSSAGESKTVKKGFGIPWHSWIYSLGRQFFSMCGCLDSLSHVWLFVTPLTVALSASLSMGILQARILEWVAIPFSRGSSQPKNWTGVSYTAGRFFTSWATREALCIYVGCVNCGFHIRMVKGTKYISQQKEMVW